MEQKGEENEQMKYHETIQPICFPPFPAAKRPSLKIKLGFFGDRRVTQRVAEPGHQTISVYFKSK